MKIMIVGAGAAGIMAANMLSKKGFSVTVLEQQERIGGRIHTYVPEGFVNAVEAGAEFIHGHLPLTLKLLKRAQLATTTASMNMHRIGNGKIVHGFGRSKAWGQFYALLEALEADTTLDAFLGRHFPGKKYRLLRDEVQQMAQGLDLADPAEVSLLSLKAEWLSEETQYRPVTGYQPLLEFLYNKAAAGGCKIIFNETVKSIRWERGRAVVHTLNQSFENDIVIITSSLGCLQSEDIKFAPEIPELLPQFQRIGFGAVIKLLFEFDQPFWEQELPELGFLFAEKGFTFWTQLDQHVPVLTGWIGNDCVSHYDAFSDEALINISLETLLEAFPETQLHFRTAAVFRYNAQSPSRGGYSWPKPESRKAVKQLNKGIEDTIFFAGEAFDPTFETATVEAALESGKYVAGRIIRKFRRDS
ncbi:NAD(P)/FAD-dependent oxidoreductase [Flavobacterium sp. BFFFF1]|uniref:flavin monoamine oxidase family protein n=1 Tax=Flavobacterium sp. BFFFF1 TaxID=2015557 RepID=UPI0025C2288A|nr:NAD(P)/FAD-dependent oxidoreductase [Flavobacterium sp. BFFFF1]